MLSSKKELLSFEEFQNQVIEAFNCTKEECEFWSNSSWFSSVISYTGRHWLSFTVKYAIDPENCNYGRWIVIKEYDYRYKNISDSLIQGIKVLAQKTEESIKEEIAVFKHLEK